MMSTPKSKLLIYLESRVKAVPPNDVGVTIIDAMFHLHLIYQIPATFGLLAIFLMNQFRAMEGDEIHFVADKYCKLWIKHSETSDDEPVFTFQVLNGKYPATKLSGCRI